MKTIKELEVIEKKTNELANQGRYMDENDLKALDLIPAIIQDRKDVLELIDEMPRTHFGDIEPKELKKRING